MGNYEQLKQAIANVIKTNGNQEITGAILQNSLLTIISTVGSNATFAGIANPETNPGTPDQNIFYLASEPGVYANFGGIELTDQVLVFTNKNGNWKSQDLGIATFEYAETNYNEDRISDNKLNSLSEMNIFPGQMTGGNVWSNLEIANHFVLPIKVNDKIQIVASDNQPVVYAILKDYYPVLVGENIPYADGTTRNVILAKSESEFTVSNDDAKYIAFNVNYEDLVYTPKTLIINEYNYNEDIRSKIVNIPTFEYAETNYNEDRISDNKLNSLSEMNIFPGQMTGGNVWSNLEIANHFVLPIKVNDKIQIVASDNQPVVYAILKDYYPVLVGENIPYADGTTRNVILAKSESEFTVSNDDAKYIAFNVNYENLVYTPKTLIINEYNYNEDIRSKIVNIVEYAETNYNEDRISDNKLNSLSEMNIFPGQMTGGNVWSNLEIANHFVLPIKVNDKIQIVASDNQPVVYAILKDYYPVLVGENIPYADGTTRNVILAKRSEFSLLNYDKYLV